MLRKPTRAELPAGPRRLFVEELWFHYEAIERPPLRRIKSWIDEHPDGLRGTASIETIRRALRGETVPSWLTAETILIALCGMADHSIDEDRWQGEDWDQSNDGATYKTELYRRWGIAVDDDRSVQPGGAAPWNDEPPF